MVKRYLIYLGYDIKVIEQAGTNLKQEKTIKCFGVGSKQDS